MVRAHPSPEKPMDSLDDIYLDADDKMSKAVAFLQQEFGGLRTGKASPALVENVTVDYYGAPTRLRDIAGITTPEPRLIVINPFDKSALPNVEKALIAANLGISPINDGKIIRMPVPELSEQRRKDLTKVAHRMAEEQRVAIRNVRRDSNELIKAVQKKGIISEDDRDAALVEIQKSTDDFTKKIDGMLAAKETEIAAV
jgi:ribosome recycling factor